MSRSNVSAPFRRCTNSATSVFGLYNYYTLYVHTWSRIEAGSWFPDFKIKNLWTYAAEYRLTAPKAVYEYNFYVYNIIIVYFYVWRRTFLAATGLITIDTSKEPDLSHTNLHRKLKKIKLDRFTREVFFNGSDFYHWMCIIYVFSDSILYYHLHSVSLRLCYRFFLYALFKTTIKVFKELVVLTIKYKYDSQGWIYTGL